MNTLSYLFLNFAYREQCAEVSFVVGGAVRDVLLNTEVKDLDIAVKGDAVALARKFADTIGAAFVLLDEHFATARVVKGDHCVDIAALRGGSIYTDLAERDLTINAMALPLTSLAALRVTSYALQEIIDPCKGRRDLADRIIRMIAEENLRKDPLRLLRVYRFAAVLGFSIDPATRQSVNKLAGLITTVAAERIAEELRAMLGAGRSSPAVTAMMQDGLLSSLFPALSPERSDSILMAYGKAEDILNDPGASFPGNEKPVREYFAADERRTGTKLAALFPRPDEALAAAVQLKLSVREREFIHAVSAHRRDIELLYRGGDHSDRSVLLFIKRHREHLYPLLVLSLAGAGAAGEDPASDHGFQAFCRSLLRSYHEELLPRMRLLPLITGDDLIQVFHLAPSPLFKEILGTIEDMVAEGAVTTKKEALSTVKDILSGTFQTPNSEFQTGDE